jgi:cytoskeletal protein RodZ
MVRNNDDSSINDFRSGENKTIKTEKKNDQENMLTSCLRFYIIIGWTKVKLRIAAKLFYMK